VTSQIVTERWNNEGSLRKPLIGWTIKQTIRVSLVENTIVKMTALILWLISVGYGFLSSAIRRELT
jgi:hypothetical protein